jgi:hypothetical protein
MLALVASVVLAATPLYTPGEPEQDRFKALFKQGEQLYKDGLHAGDPKEAAQLYGAAIYNFLRADEIRTTPEVAYDLAKAYEKIGSAAFSTYYYRLYLKRAPNASDSLDVAERVGNALNKNEQEGRGFLEVTSFGATDITIGAQRYPEGPVAIFLPPGDYELTAHFPAGVKKTAISIRTGKTTSLVFEPEPAPLLSSTEGAPDEALNVETSHKVRPLRVTSYAVAGLGLAAVAAGCILGAMSASDASQLNNHTLRVSDAQALANSANTKGAGANIAWGAGGVLIGTGVVMWIVSREPAGPAGAGEPESQP